MCASAANTALACCNTTGGFSILTNVATLQGAPTAAVKNAAYYAAQVLPCAVRTVVPEACRCAQPYCSDTVGSHAFAANLLAVAATDD